jgi:hypothetical protein
VLPSSLLIAGLVVAAVPAVGSASAEEDPGSAREQARMHYETGVAAFEAGDYDTALENLEESYRLFASLRTLYSIGLAHHAVGDYPAALRALRRYLEEGGTEVPEDLRARAETLLAEMRDRVARLDVRVDVEGALVRIDGAPAGTTPLPAPIEVGPGRHVVEVAADGYVSRAQRTFVNAGAQNTLLFLLEPAPAATAPEPEPPPVAPAAETRGPPPGVSEQEWYGVGDAGYRRYVYETGRRRPLANWILDANRESDEMLLAEVACGTLGPSWLAAGTIAWMFIDDEYTRTWMSTLEWALGGVLTLAAIVLAVFDAVDYGSVDVAHPERLFRLAETGGTSTADGGGRARVTAALGPGGLELRF